MASGHRNRTDGLFRTSSQRTVKVANKREGQDLGTRIRSMNREMRLSLTRINYHAKKTNEKLVKMKKEIDEKIEHKLEETTPSIDQDDYDDAANLYGDDNDPIPSIKQLITFAMAQLELEKEENQRVAVQDDLTLKVSTTDDPLTQSAELVRVTNTVETDKTQASGINNVLCDDNIPTDPEVMTVDEVKALIVHIYGTEESEFNLDSVIACLLPILRKTEVKMNETQLGKSNGKLILLKQVLSSEFPEAYVQHEQAALQALNREKQLWKKFNSGKILILPPIYQNKETKLEARSWDIDTPIQIPVQFTDEEWEEIRYCHYLRPPVKRT